MLLVPPAASRFFVWRGSARPSAMPERDGDRRDEREREKEEEPERGNIARKRQMEGDRERKRERDRYDDHKLLDHPQGSIRRPPRVAHLFVVVATSTSSTESPLFRGNGGVSGNRPCANFLHSGVFFCITCGSHRLFTLCGPVS